MKVIYLFIVFLYSSYSFADLKVELEASRTKAGINVPIHFQVGISSDLDLKTEVDWKFGDGFSVVNGGKNISHKFNKEGSFSIEVTVREIGGDKVLESMNIEIVENTFPKFSIKPKGNEIIVNEPALLLVTVDDNDENLEYFEWEIVGESSVFRDRYRIYHTFSKPGPVIIKYNAIDSLGGFDTGTLKLEVFEPNIPPKVKLGYGSALDDFYTNEPIEFEAISSDEDGKVEKIEWKFDRQAKYIEGKKKIEKKFHYEGQKSIFLRVTDDRGAQSEIIQEIYVTNRASFPELKIITSNDDRLVENKLVKFGIFFQSGRRKIKEIEWNLRDGSSPIKTKKNFNHRFTVAGIYAVKAKVFFKGGNSIELVKEIEIKPESISSKSSTVGQVLINDYEYYELNPGEERDIGVTVYGLDGLVQLSSYPTPTYQLSNSNATIGTNFWGGKYIKAVSAGSVKLKVIVDGIESQEIDIQINNFSNNIAVSRFGKFNGWMSLNLGIHLNRTTNPENYFVQSNRSTGIDNFDIDTGNGYAYLSTFHTLTDSQNSVDIEISSPDINETVTVSNIKKFHGRKGYAFFQDGFNTKMTNSLGLDERIHQFNNDFTISFWMFGDFISWSSTGAYDINVTRRSITVLGNSFAKRINLPFDNHGWAFYSLTYENSSRTFTVFRNGLYYSDIIIPSSPKTNANSIVIENSSAGIGRFDELRVWNKILNSTEINDELFNPVSENNSSIITAFNFDSTLNQVITSASGAEEFLLGVDERQSTDDPKILLAPNSVFNGTIDNSIDLDTSFSIPQTKVGRTTGRIYLQKDSFSAPNQSLYLTHFTFPPRSWLTRLTEENRISDFFHYSTSQTDQLLPSPIIEIPFDSQSSLSINPEKIKVGGLIQSITGTQNHILEPLEINVEEGVVRFRPIWQGVYWITVPSNFDDIYDNYDDPIGNPTLFSYYPFRAFGHDLNGSQSFQLSSSSYDGSPEIEYISCNGTEIPLPTNYPQSPIDMQNLTQDYNWCVVNYLFTGPYIPYYKYRYRDIFLFVK